MNKPKTTYDLSDFEERGHAKTSADKKRPPSTGLSVTKLGRLSLTLGLQKEMGIDPVQRDKVTYVKVLHHKASEGYDRYTFFIQFSDKVSNPPYKLYKPKRKEKFDTSNDTSYFEFARFLKIKGLVEKVGDAKNLITPGPVDIIDRDPKNRSIVINLKSRFID